VTGLVRENTVVASPSSRGRQYSRGTADACHSGKGGMRRPLSPGEAGEDAEKQVGTTERPPLIYSW